MGKLVNYVTTLHKATKRSSKYENKIWSQISFGLKTGLRRPWKKFSRTSMLELIERQVFQRDHILLSIKMQNYQIQN